METWQNFLEIRRIFCDVIENEVRNYLNRKAVSRDTQLDFPKSKIDFFNVYGDMIFLGYKYELLGDGKGRNSILERVDGKTHSLASTFLIQNLDKERCVFRLFLAIPDSVHTYSSYFEKVLRKSDTPSFGNTVYHLDGEEMLECSEFKKCFLEIIKDLAPERLDEVQSLLA